MDNPRDWTSGAAEARRTDATQAPGSPTPVGAELLVPSTRGVGRGPTVQTSETVPNSIQGKGRGSQLAAAMHATRAAAADASTARATSQREARLERRRGRAG